MKITIEDREGRAPCVVIEGLCTSPDYELDRINHDRSNPPTSPSYWESRAVERLQDLQTIQNVLRCARSLEGVLAAIAGLKARAEAAEKELRDAKSVK